MAISDLRTQLGGGTPALTTTSGYTPPAQEYTTARLSTDVAVDSGLTGVAVKTGRTLGYLRARAWHDAVAAVRRCIRNYPAASLLTACAGGLAIGLGLRYRL